VSKHGATSGISGCGTILGCEAAVSSYCRRFCGNKLQ
jgi:hypothetical protein